MLDFLPQCAADKMAVVAFIMYYVKAALCSHQRCRILLAKIQNRTVNCTKRKKEKKEEDTQMNDCLFLAFQGEEKNGEV